MTYTLAREIELLCFHLWEDFQELLHKANQLSRKIVLILGFAKYHLSSHQVGTTHFDIRLPLRKSGTNGLFNPENAR